MTRPSKRILKLAMKNMKIVHDPIEATLAAVIDYLEEQYEEKIKDEDYGVLDPARTTVPCTDPNCDIPEPQRSRPHSHWVAIPGHISGPDRKSAR